MFNFSAHLTEHCTTSESARQGDREFFFRRLKLNVSRLGDQAPLEHSLGYELKKNEEKEEEERSCVLSQNTKLLLKHVGGTQNRSPLQQEALESEIWSPVGLIENKHAHQPQNRFGEI